MTYQWVISGLSIEKKGSYNRASGKAG